ncbi:MAG TPA: DUF4386 domain-containing protein [Streptosporangiaceae bacterium]|jgi:hypothetical protein|nr:DUF4386 domain-containing protein [Streptosporangiaceae bacterium]
MNRWRSAPAGAAPAIRSELPPRTAATTAGLGLLAMALVSALSFAAFNMLVVQDPARTARNIAEHEAAFRALTCGFLVVAVLDVLVAWALYELLAPVNKSLALLAAWLRVMYAAVFAAVLSNLLVAVRLLTDATVRGAFDPRQADAQAVASVHAFKDGWDTALVIFGLHLLVLGYLVLRSGYVPRTLGVLLMIASTGYVVDGLGRLLSRDYHANVAGFTFVGEVLLMVWLLWKGRRLPDPATAPAPV